MYLAAWSIQKIALVCVAALVWVGSAFWAAGYARDNGGDYGLWLLIGTLTGPLGLIASFLYFRVESDKQRRARHSVKGTHDIPEMMPCPNCGQHIPSGFERCQFCGADLRHGRRR